ncbi:cytochrome P450 [Aspergillus keveii]|uniref:Cytochrome P450 n=1 Tax=Aspergillus keveii TaxID=714993 RepID=A0ABR4G8W6_9EURO
MPSSNWDGSYLPVLGLALLASYELGWIIYCRFFHPLRAIPGPLLASISRVWLVHQAATGHLEQTQRALHRKYGSLVRIAPNEVICSDLAVLKTIYGHKSTFIKSDFYDAWAAPNEIGYPGHFAVRDEKLHTEQRRIVNNLYSMSSILNSEQYIDSCTKTLTKSLDGLAAEQETIVDLSKLLNMYTFDVLGELFYGKSFDMVAQRKDVGDFGKSIESLLPIFAVGGTLPSYLTGLYLMYKITFSSSLRGAITATKNIAVASEEAIARRSHELDNNSNDKPDMLRRMLETTAERGGKADFTRRHVHVESQVALFAGADTTSTALTTIFYYIFHNPTAYKTLLAEIDAAYTAGIFDASTPISYKDSTSALPYLKACVNEALRLHPGVAFHLPRVVPAGGATIAGVYIPAGYRVGVNAAVVQYDKDVFGPDADTFNPDRWLNGESAVAMQRIMMPFGMGARTCIGMHIALCQIYKLIPHILRHFEIEFVEPRKPLQTRNFWFMKLVDVKVRFMARKLNG